MNRSLCFALPILLATIVAGCSGGSGHPVKGTVKFDDGSPLAAGMVIFDSGTYSDSAKLGPDGTFTIENGLPAGSYKVTLGGDALGSYDSPGALVNKKYGSHETTDLSATVEAKQNQIDLVVQKP